MAGQNWFTNAEGAFLSNDTLSEELRTVGQPMFRYRQFAKMEQKYGRKSGQLFLFNRQSNLTAPLTGAYLSQNVPIPRYGVTFSQGTLTARESGNAIPWNELFETFSEQEVKGQVIVNALVNDMAKQMDYRCAIEGVEGSDVVYTPTGTDAVPTATWSVTGTASTPATRRIQVYDIKEWRDAFDWGVYGSNTYAPAPRYDGANFVMVGSVGALRSIEDDPEWQNAQYYGDPEKLFSGEKGRIAGVRMVTDNHLAGRVNLNSASHSLYTDECTIFADDAMIEGSCIAEEVRDGIPSDFQRDMASAWYTLCGFQNVWPVSAGDNRIIRVRST